MRRRRALLVITLPLSIYLIYNNTRLFPVTPAPDVPTYSKSTESRKFTLSMASGEPSLDVGRQKFLSTAKIPLSIAIVVVVKEVDSAFKNYSLALSTLQCYAGVQNYSFHVLAMQPHSNTTSEWERVMLKKCTGEWERQMRSQTTHIMQLWGTPFKFQRHCVVAEFMAANPHYDYVLFLDADIGVINPERRIEEFIDEDQRVNLYFYDKDSNANIMAGSYLAKNTKQSRRFLIYIANYIWLLGERAENVFYKNSLDSKAELHDNFVFNAIFLRKFATAEEVEQCEKHLKPKSSIYTACTRYYLSKHATEGIYYNSEEVGRVKILPKFEGWARDGTTLNTEKWSVEKDFMLHGWKQRQLDIPAEMRANDSISIGRLQYWTSPLVGEAPLETEQCLPEIKSEVIRLYWKERWNRETMLSGKELEALLIERRREWQERYKVYLAKFLAMRLRLLFARGEKKL